MIGQVYYNNYLYSFGVNKSNSYKFNLNTREMVGNLNVPSITVSILRSFGAVMYNNDIYVYYVPSGVDRKLVYYIYHINTDTYEEPVTTTITTPSYNYHTNPIFYDNKAYMFCQNSSNALRHTIVYDFVEGTFSEFDFGGSAIIVYYVGYNDSRYFYSGASSGQIYRFDLIGRGSTSLFSLPVPYSSTYNGYIPYSDRDYWYYPLPIPIGNYIYCFGTGATLKYILRKNLTSNQLERLEIQYGYNIRKPSENNSFANSPQIYFFDSENGFLYFRECYHTTNTYALQLNNPNSIIQANDGEILLVPTFDYSRPTLIQDKIGFIASIGNTYIVKNGEANGGHFSAWGDGNKWNIIKNLNSLVRTVQFDVNGGVGEFDSVQVTAGQSIASPESQPTKSGCAFDGWSLNGEKFVFGSTLIVTDCTLKAIWIPYENVNYIHSDGNAYIDTGVKATNNISVKIKFRPTSLTSSAHAVFGTYETSGNKSFSIYASTSSVNQRVGNQSISRAGNFFAVNNIYDVEMNNVGQTVNGELTSWSATPSSFTSTNNMYIFFASGASYYLIGDIYYCKIYSGGNLIRNFVPVVDNNGRYGMYESLADKMYYGTGTFSGD